MRSTTTISLPAKMQRAVARAAKRQNLTLSEYVRRALQDKLWQEAIAETRRMLVPHAQALGIYTDEDVFKLIS